MTELESFRKPFGLALRFLLMRWNLWLCGEQVRALDIAFDCFNTEICVSLLTSREPVLEASGEDPLGQPWPVGSWRLTGISKSARHCFPDAADLVTWMSDAARRTDTGAPTEELNESVKRFFFEVATSDMILEEIRRFKGKTTPFHIRVHWFFERQPALYFSVP